MSEKVYIGDGVYVHNDGWHVIVEAENESGSPARIYLEPTVLNKLIAYAKLIGCKLEATGQELKKE